MQPIHAQNKTQKINIKFTISKNFKSQSAIKQNFFQRDLIKNQSAMEYLMTYGWAILIIAIVLVALFQMGVFNSANFAPKAQPGSCQVFRTTAATSLEGTCNNELPQYVALFKGIVTSNVTSNIGNLPVGSSARTVAAWINPASVSNYPSIVTWGDCGSYSWLSQLGISSSGTLEFAGTGHQFTQYQFVSSFIIPPKVWTFVAFSYASGSSSITLYSDQNSQSNSITGSLSTLSGTPFQIGSNNYDITQCYGDPFNGLISNVQVYNASLSANDIKSLYYEGIGGAPQNTQNLVGWWPLNGNANDYSGNNNNGAAANVVYTGSWAGGYSAP